MASQRKMRLQETLAYLLRRFRRPDRAREAFCPREGGRSSTNRSTRSVAAAYLIDSHIAPHPSDTYSALGSTSDRMREAQTSKFDFRASRGQYLWRLRFPVRDAVTTRDADPREVRVPSPTIPAARSCAGGVLSKGGWQLINKPLDKERSDGVPDGFPHYPAPSRHLFHMLVHSTRRV